MCGKQVHLLLATSHVESHFGAVEGEVTAEAGPGDQPSAAPSSAEDARAAAAERAEGDASSGGACGGGDDEDVGLENAEFGGALAPPPPAAPDGQAPSYVPGTDAVWAAFKLQARHRVAAPLRCHARVGGNACAQTPAPPAQVMSGDFRSCGICMERFEPGVRDRFLLLPCQHARQCGACALTLWLMPKAKRRCPWCKGKLDIRPRAFRPFL